MHLSATFAFLRKFLALAFGAASVLMGDHPRRPALRVAMAGAMAAMAGLAALVVLIVSPRLRDPLGGAELTLALPTRGLFLVAGMAALWPALVA